ncbi:hypothetical protein SNEBB_001341 [Seison nebaliae]|nr:hypothetical protein SNEBB_001341 [Seison nebaliae]
MNQQTRMDYCLNVPTCPSSGRPSSNYDHSIDSDLIDHPDDKWKTMRRSHRRNTGPIRHMNNRKSFFNKYGRRYFGRIRNLPQTTKKPNNNLLVPDSQPLSTNTNNNNNFEKDQEKQILPVFNQSVIHELYFARAKLKAVMKTSALLSGFAMVAMVEQQIERSNNNSKEFQTKFAQSLHNTSISNEESADQLEDVTMNYLLITFSFITALSVGIHLLALLIATCILPHIETSIETFEHNIPSFTSPIIKTNDDDNDYYHSSKKDNFISNDFIPHNHQMIPQQVSPPNIPFLILPEKRSQRSSQSLDDNIHGDHFNERESLFEIKENMIPSKRNSLRKRSSIFNCLSKKLRNLCCQFLCFTKCCLRFKNSQPKYDYDAESSNGHNQTHCTIIDQKIMYPLHQCYSNTDEVKKGRVSQNRFNESIQQYIELSWILSTGIGIFLFLLDLVLVAAVKFFLISRIAMFAALSILIPILFIFVTFALRFYRLLVSYRIRQLSKDLAIIPKHTLHRFASQSSVLPSFIQQDPHVKWHVETPVDSIADEEKSRLSSQQKIQEKFMTGRPYKSTVLLHYQSTSKNTTLSPPHKNERSSSDNYSTASSSKII